MTPKPILTLSLRRAPVMLRVVIGPKGTDTLDQLEDTPAADESIHVYRLTEQPSSALVDGRDPKTGRRTGGQRFIARYELLPEQPDEATLRDNGAWARWCHNNFVRLKPAWVGA